MRILIVNKFLYPRGGTETYMIKLGQELKSMGHQVEYFGMYDSMNTVGNSIELYPRHVDFHKRSLQMLTYPRTIIYSKEAKEMIKEVVRAFKPDVAHINNINFHLTPSVIDGLYEEHVPIVSTAHDFQMVCPNHLLYIPLKNELCEACVHELSPKCVREKCIHGSSARSMLGYIEAMVYRDRKTYDKIEKIICPSVFMKNTLDQVPMFRDKTVFLRNFSADMQPSKDYPGRQHDDYILYFGRLYEEKGIRNLVEAMKELPDIQLRIAGSGPLEKLVEGIPNIIYLGFQVGFKLYDLIADAKFTVYPSVWYENCPLSVMESQKLGTPCLMTDIGGMKELAGHGLTIQGTSAEHVRSAIRHLYDSPELLQCMRDELPLLVSGYPSLSQYAERCVALYAG